jgi:hypothetical protein
MRLTEETKAGLDTLLYEADLLGFEIDPDRQIGAATFKLLTLPEVGPAPLDSRYQFLFSPVSRVVASMRRDGETRDGNKVKSFELEELLGVVESFGGRPIYGQSFFNVHEKTLDEIARRVSLDWRSGAGGDPDSISLFQESDGWTLDLCVWFESLVIRTPNGEEVSLDAVVADVQRWWKRMHERDPRTGGRGIAPYNRKSFHQSWARELFELVRNLLR